MPGPSLERHFEIAVVAAMVESAGWTEGNRESYDRAAGVDWSELTAFVKETQSDSWAGLVETQFGGDSEKAEAEFKSSVVTLLNSQGTLRCLRRGITVRGVDCALSYARPEHGLTQSLVERYEANRLTVARQLRYAADNTNTLDLTFFLNGVPVATAELKNELTGQNVEDAKRQYRTDRDPDELLFAKRALVHFAVDTTDVYLTTRLAGEETTFVPFNKGHDGMAGNPPAPKGKYPTSYLWDEVWQRDSWIDIIHRFIHLQRASGGPQVVFPRFHQLQSVRRLVADANSNGPGSNYLLEHSAGSGKSNTIGWLSHRLAVLHDADDDLVFDKVIVVTDRIALDRQLQNTVFQFEHQPGLVQKVEGTSAELAEALNSRTARVVITTLQKFPFVLDQTGDLSNQDFAVIVDEAHSSQGGEAAKYLREALSVEPVKKASAEEEEELSPDEVQDLIAASVAARGRRESLSYFAFTATPTAQTLELFGTAAKDGLRKPFHLYSMRQAISERFILNVLKHYTPFEVLWKVASNTAEVIEVQKGKASAAIVKFVAQHAETLEAKAGIIVEHFHATTRHKIGGEAKAMVVTSSREHAVKTFFAIRTAAEERGFSECLPLVAFSDSVEIDRESYTEAKLNGFGSGEIESRFASPDHRILVVAEKYQTGFDQPLLHTMYVDKQLSGLRAVQTLSRLNRVHPKKDDTFVLDFANDPEVISAAFAPYYEMTVARPTDPAQLYSAHGDLLSHGVIAEDEELEFAKVFLGRGDDPSAHVELINALEPARQRFLELGGEEAIEFRETLARFIDMYSWMAQAVAFSDTRLEATYLYARHLERMLPRDPSSGGLDAAGSVVLTHLRIEAGEEEQVEADQGDVMVEPPAGEAGVAPEPVTETLDGVIEQLNERFGANLGPQDRLILEKVLTDLSQDGDLVTKAKANSKESFLLVFESFFEDEVMRAESSNREFFERFFSDKDFRRSLIEGAGAEFHRRQQGD